jgi:hypothetical protein
MPGRRAEPNGPGFPFRLSRQDTGPSAYAVHSPSSSAPSTFHCRSVGPGAVNTFCIPPPRYHERAATVSAVLTVRLSHARHPSDNRTSPIWMGRAAAVLCPKQNCCNSTTPILRPPHHHVPHGIDMNLFQQAMPSPSREEPTVRTALTVAARRAAVLTLAEAVTRWGAADMRGAGGAFAGLAWS